MGIESGKCNDTSRDDNDNSCPVNVQISAQQAFIFPLPPSHSGVLRRALSDGMVNESVDDSCYTDKQ